MPNKTSKTNTKPVTAVTKKESSDPRVIKEPKYRSFRLQKKLPKPGRVQMRNSFHLFGSSLNILRRHWRLFLGITFIFAVLNLLLVQGFFNADVTSAKQAAESQASGGYGQVITGASALSALFSSAGGDASTSAYRLVLLVVGSLAIIWALRHVLAGNKIRIRDAFYEGMTPFVPFVLVFMVISLELAPLALGLYLYNVAASTSGLEITVWAVLLTSLSILTLYWLSSSLFALYIVSLPGMQPVEALRAAVRLVRHRRWMVLRKILFLPIAIGILMVVIMAPFIFLAVKAASAAFFIFIMMILPIIHGYMYMVYRELLHDKKQS